MHELSIARALATAVERHLPPALPRVVSVRVVVGAATGVVFSALELAFRAITAESRLQGARLVLERAPAHSRCMDCTCTYAFDDVIGVCPYCGGLGGELIDGDDIELRSIEVADV